MYNQVSQNPPAKCTKVLETGGRTVVRRFLTEVSAMKEVMRNRTCQGFGALLLVVLLVLGGCAPSATPTPAPSPTSPPAPIGTTAPAPKVTQAPTTAPAPKATAAPTTAPAPKLPIKIGVLNPLSGHLAAAGEEGNRGIEMYFDVNGWEIAGRKIELIKEDDEASPKTALEKTRKLVEHDKVRILTGIVSSAVAIALRDYVDAQKVPLILGMSGAWDLCFDRKSDYVLNPVHLNGDHSYGIAKYAYEKLGYKKAIVMASDYAAAYDFIDVFQGAFEEAGGQVVQKVLTPFGNTDFAPYLVGLKEADFVWAFYADRESVAFINQYCEFGLNKKMPIMGGQGGVTTPAVIKGVGDKAIGVYVGSHTPPFGALPGSPASETFAAAFQKKYGVPAGPMAYTGYQQAQSIAKAAEAVSGNVEDTPQFLQAMKALKFEGLCGPVKFEPGYNWATCNIFTFKVVKKEGQYGFELLSTHKDVGPSLISRYRRAR